MSMLDTVAASILELVGGSEEAARRVAVLVARRSSDLAIMRLTGEPGVKKAEERAVAECRLAAIAELQQIAAAADERLQGQLLAFLRVGTAVGLQAWGGA